MHKDQAEEVVEALEAFIDAKMSADPLPKATRRGAEAHEWKDTCKEILIDALSNT